MLNGLVRVSTALTGGRFARAALVLLLAGISLAGALHYPYRATAHRQLVVVYYANETSSEASASDNYRALLAALRSSGNEAGTQIAHDIESDSKIFWTVVQKDQEALFTAAKNIGFDLAYFDNTKTLKGHFLQFDREVGEIRQLQFPALSPADNPILATSPLSRPEALRSALASVASLYPARDLDIALITFTHGSADMAIIPRVSTNLTAPDAQREFLEQLSGSGGSQAPAWAKIQGISKREYWQIIADASRTDANGVSRVRFPLVFRQSCASGLLNWSEFRSIPDSVRTVAHSGMQNMHLEQMDYRAIFSNFGPASAWLETFKSRIEASNVQVQTRRTLWIRPVMTNLGSVNLVFFFVPLMAWIGWLVVMLRQKTQAAL